MLPSPDLSRVECSSGWGARLPNKRVQSDTDDAMSPGCTLNLHKTKSFVVLDIGADGSPIGVEVLAPDASLKAELRRRAV